MGVAVGLILIAAGAIVAFAINREPSEIDLDAVGWILIVVGFVAVLLDLLWWHSWSAGPWRRTTYVEGAPAPRSYGRRRRVVEEDVAGPPDAPPPP
jgi:Domain of unknown function (DUF6458)